MTRRLHAVVFRCYNVSRLHAWENMFWDNHLVEWPERPSRLGGEAEGFSGKSEGRRLLGIPQGVLGSPSS